MTTIYSIDGQTVTKRYRTAPREHWVQDTPDTGHFVPADISVGYFPLVEVAQPSPDHVVHIERVGDQFVTVWTFDRAAADARTAEAAEQTERDAARNLIGALDTYLALNRPTADEMRQQVDRLTRIAKRLIRDQYGR